jgi:predicted esterase YcpF (UPF0227 family)
MPIEAPLIPNASRHAGGPRIVYLHGFRSSPRSAKARWLALRMNTMGRGAQFICPQLPPSPREAIEMIRVQFDLQPADTLIGSSLGGYYATWLAERYGCRAVLLNPAIDPAKGLRDHVGLLKMYHSDDTFVFRPEYLDELRAIDVPMISFPQRYYLIAAKGDELIDWRDMVAHYPGARVRVLEGSDHSLTDFADYGYEVLEFAGIRGAGG